MRNFILIFISFLFLHVRAQIDTINFESSSFHLILDSSNVGNIWQIAHPSKVVFDSAYSAPRAIITDSINPYPINNQSSFMLGFELNGGQPYIEFKHRFDTDSLHDGGYVEISKDSGQTWLLLSDTINLGYINGYYNQYGLQVGGFYGVNDSLQNGKIGFSGKSNGWTSSVVQFPCFALKQPWELLLRFTFVSDSIDNFRDGWMIDNIYIYNTGICSGVEENPLEILHSFPNPFSGSTRIELGELFLNNGSYTLYNIEGKTIRSHSEITGNAFEIDRDNLQAGVYLLILKENGIPVGRGRLFVQ